MSEASEVAFGGKDFLVHAVSGTLGNPVLERIRDKGAEVVMAVYRLAKTALVHALENQAIAAAVRTATTQLTDFAVVVGGTVSLTFVGDTVFVCGQLLRASRGTYESAVELGAIFGRAGVSEVTFSGNVTPEAIQAFAGAIATSMRDPSRRDELLRASFLGIIVRKSDPLLDRDERDDDLPSAERIVRLYAAALVVMRRFFDGLASGSTLLPHRVKRLAQSLVTLAETGDPLMVGMTAMANAHRDDAGRAVQSALLTIVTTRLITSSRVPLARLAMAALLADVGRVRLVGEAGRDRLVRLSDDVEAQVPSTSSAVCLAMAGVNMQNALRTVVVHEATWVEREPLLGKLYGGEMSPLLEARILHMVRTLLDKLAPRHSAKATAPLDALAEVAKDRSIDPVLFRLLVRAVGLIPVGSVVELESGEWAVVVGPSKNPRALDRPLLRIVTDASGRALTKPKEVDLGAASGDHPTRIARLIEPKGAGFSAVSAFLR